MVSYNCSLGTTLPSRLSPPLGIAKGYAYGVARDGVTSVAFTFAGGGRVNVPVSTTCCTSGVHEPAAVVQDGAVFDCDAPDVPFRIPEPEAIAPP